MTAFEIVPCCPLCQSPLVEGVSRIYETTADHVCDPNGTPPIRPTLVCRTNGCAAQRHDIFWDPVGGIDDFYVEGTWPDSSVIKKLSDAAKDSRSKVT